MQTQQKVLKMYSLIMLILEYNFMNAGKTVPDKIYCTERQISIVENNIICFLKVKHQFLHSGNGFNKIILTNST